ncbi:Appr-1-p processing protein [Sporosarcina sp. P13]|uniref:type II toxin-antitoxin system antitoxin DNA ADP-ribosyl glycohydrolase DarG n=1 Tax=Sporosarcina sp. P13 TaxID=2048263 RepID=UPI000C164A34|nr:macro domain-containing protein [Sporosarcina sp. P13]PIC63461.1 Appr-1-p processing protein [Sporosarcina sp. P13]
MIKSVQGNLLEDSAEAYVNTVNTVGVMGKGIALQFKQAFPDVFKQYAKDCKNGQVHVGQMHIVPTFSLTNPKYIINFPTKQHWRNPSKLDFIKEGLEDLKRVIKENNIKSIALPPVGCGNGGLDWAVVRPLIIDAFQDEAVDVHLYEPFGAPQVDKMIVRTEPPKMTKGRALLLAAMNSYKGPGYKLSQLEVQKLAYFLFEIDALPRLRFQKSHYGPYAENLNHVLQRMEGHMIRGYGDRTTDSEIYILDDVMDDVHLYLQNDSTSLVQLEKLEQLIDGFENPYGLELLSSVYWIMKHSPSQAQNMAYVVQELQNWNERKKRIFSVEHIHEVWEYLSHEVKLVS